MKFKSYPKSGFLNFPAFNLSYMCTSHEMSNVQGLIQDMQDQIANLESSLKMMQYATHWTVDLGLSKTIKRRYS